MNNASRPATVPIVFVSSTAEDLKQHRAAAKDAAIAAGCLPRMMEYFAASGDKPPLDACLAKVSEADVLVVIVAQRFGWVPPDQQADQHKSITWLECERAAAGGREILAFLLEETHPWPEEAREEYALTEALREGKATPDLLQSVQGKITSLRQFKTWLSNRAIRATFTTPEQLHGKVLHALHEWRQRQPGLAPAPAKGPPADLTTYLRSLLAQNAFIDIRGLQVGAAERWGKVGRPWILFYFDNEPKLSSAPADVQQYLKVCTFREELQKLGIVGAYTGVRGSKVAFFDQVELHLRHLIQNLQPIPGPAPRALGKKKKNAEPAKTPRQPPVVPPAYRDWLSGPNLRPREPHQRDRSDRSA